MTRGFLTTLGHYGAHGGQEENQLSATFSACFNNAKSFRTAIVAMLWEHLGNDGPLPRTDWQCRTQVRTPDGDGWLDLVIEATAGGRAHGRRWPRFVIENKLGAPLTVPQLERYHKSERHLVAITRRHPEPSPRMLRRLGVAALRWHDVYRVLKRATPTSASDRFIVEAFLEYLEDAEMFQPEITNKALRGVQKTFQLIAATKSRVGVFVDFRSTQGLMDVLEDIVHDLDVDRALRRWGPGYYKNTYSRNEGVLHQLGFSIHRDRRQPTSGRDRWAEYYFAFPEKQGRAPYGWAGLWVPGEDGPRLYRKWSARELGKTDRLGGSPWRAEVTKHMRKCVTAVLDAG